MLFLSTLFPLSFRRVTPSSCLSNSARKFNKIGPGPKKILRHNCFHFLDLSRNSNQPPITYFSNVASLLDCQAMCKNYGSCGYFGYDCNGHKCYLKTQSGGTVYDAAMTSGPPIC